MLSIVDPLPPDRIKVELGSDPTSTVQVQFYDPDVSLSKTDKYFIILYDQTSLGTVRTRDQETPEVVVRYTVPYVGLMPGALYNVTFTSQVFNIKNSITVFEDIYTSKFLPCRLREVSVTFITFKHLGFVGHLILFCIKVRHIL